MGIRARIEKLEQQSVPTETRFTEFTAEETEQWIERVLADDYEPLAIGDLPDTPTNRWIKSVLEETESLLNTD